MGKRSTNGPTSSSKKKKAKLEHVDILSEVEVAVENSEEDDLDLVLDRMEEEERLCHIRRANVERKESEYGDIDEIEYESESTDDIFAYAEEKLYANDDGDEDGKSAMFMDFFISRSSYPTSSTEKIESNEDEVDNDVQNDSVNEGGEKMKGARKGKDKHRRKRKDSDEIPNGTEDLLEGHTDKELPHKDSADPVIKAVTISESDAYSDNKRSKKGKNRSEGGTGVTDSACTQKPETSEMNLYLRRMNKVNPSREERARREQQRKMQAFVKQLREKVTFS